MAGSEVAQDLVHPPVQTGLATQAALPLTSQRLSKRGYGDKEDEDAYVDVNDDSARILKADESLALSGIRTDTPGQDASDSGLPIRTPNAGKAPNHFEVSNSPSLSTHGDSQSQIEVKSPVEKRGENGGEGESTTTRETPSKELTVSDANSLLDEEAHRTLPLGRYGSDQAEVSHSPNLIEDDTRTVPKTPSRGLPTWGVVVVVIGVVTMVLGVLSVIGYQSGWFRRGQAPPEYQMSRRVVVGEDGTHHLHGVRQVGPETLDRVIRRVDVPPPSRSATGQRPL